jgi:hypothetical protein
VSVVWGVSADTEWCRRVKVLTRSSPLSYFAPSDDPRTWCWTDANKVVSAQSRLSGKSLAIQHWRGEVAWVFRVHPWGNPVTIRSGSRVPLDSFRGELRLRVQPSNCRPPGICGQLLRTSRNGRRQIRLAERTLGGLVRATDWVGPMLAGETCVAGLHSPQVEKLGVQKRE